MGPFAPNRNLQVPLWLALVLKKRARCRIHPPEWLNVGARRHGGIAR